MKEHVIIGKDRTVTVPDSLKKLGIQFDHNVNTIVFDCPRYADEDQTVDMSQMRIFINYMLPDKTPGSSPAENVVIDPDDENLMHFNWRITNAVTPVNGVLSTLICVKKSDNDGNELHHWNTELFQRFTVGNGMKCSDQIAEMNPDVIMHILANMDANSAALESIDERVGAVEEKLVEVEGKAEAHLSLDETLTDSTKAAPSGIVGSSLSKKMDKDNPTGTGYFSLNRRSGSTIGNYSSTEGINNAASGVCSHAEGSGTTASSESSHAEGAGSTASGKYSHAEGHGVSSGEASHAEGAGNASGSYSHAEGSGTKASGSNSHAEGHSTASGDSSHAEGTGTASGSFSHAEGGGTTASSEGSHSEGAGTIASGNYSHAEGVSTTASGIASHTEGGNKGTDGNNLADVSVTSSDFSGISNKITIKGPYSYGIQSHAEGTQTLAYGYSAHAEGEKTKAFGRGSHAEGQYAKASGSNSHAEGNGTTASGSNSHAEGGGTTASGELSHAEGGGTTASISYSHAEGNGTTASGRASHSEGQFTTASGSYSHAEGSETKASGDYSHAGGMSSEASGQSSFTHGSGAKAASNNQVVFGKYNIVDSNSKYSYILGNGTSDSERSNAHTIDQSGNAWYAGDIYIGGSGQDDENAKKLATEDFVTSQTETINNQMTDLNQRVTEAESAVRQLSAEQVAALNNMFAICAFTEDSSTVYSAFKTAFGITE